MRGNTKTGAYFETILPRVNETSHQLLSMLMVGNKYQIQLR